MVGFSNIRVPKINVLRIVFCLKYVATTGCLFFMHRYFVSFLLDSTIGLFIIYFCLKISQMLALRYKWSSLILGEYGKYGYGYATIYRVISYFLVYIHVYEYACSDFNA